MWDGLVSLFELGIFLVSSAAGGSLGLGVFVVSATTRLLTLPLTFPLAKKARARQAVLRDLQEDLAGLKKKWEADPARLMRETRSLYEANGLSMIDRSALVLGGVQAPVVIALFQAVRRVASGSPLAASSVPIAAVASTLAVTAVLAGNQANSATTTVVFALLAAGSAAAFTLMFGGGFGLYSAAFQGVSTLQGLLVRRSERKALQPASS